MLTRKRWFGGVMGLLIGAAWGQSPARADRIFLRGGGQIHGKLMPRPDDPTRWTFVGEAGKNPIIYKHEQIVQVIPDKTPLDDYVVLRARDRTTAEDEFQLGAWAEEHKYRDLAEYHYEAALKMDPRYGPAHEKLGHVFLNDRWLNADEQREAQGMVKVRGRWLTAEEKERLDDQAALANENQSWTRRLKILREQLVSGPADRAREAETRLLAIRDAHAINPVARILGTDANPGVRTLGGRVLGGITGPEASAALVSRFLEETDDSVRLALIPEIARREPDEVLPRLIRAVRSKQPLYINRAAWGLSQINARSAVPQLIQALFTTEYRTEMVPIGGGGGNGVSFGSVTSGGGGGAGFSNYTGGTYLGLTPPVVGPGVVAFGATGVPIGSGVSVGGGGVTGTGVSLGGGGGGVRYMQQVVPIQHPNVEVLAALKKLTNQDFGYDFTSWSRWAAASFRSDPNPGRRVVEP